MRFGLDVGPDWRLLPADAVRATLNVRCVPAAAPAITYCQAGVRAAFGAVGADGAGRTRREGLRRLLGGMGNDPDLPVEVP